jgi:autotransporter-associated beta strand protein
MVQSGYSIKTIRFHTSHFTSIPDQFMKTKFRNLFQFSSVTLALFASPAAQADTYYWDNTFPIEAAGFGIAGGTWGTDALWSLSSAGTDTSGIAGPLITDDLNFGEATAVLDAGTVTVTGTQSANSLTFGLGSGVIVLSGGTIDLAAAATINVNNAGDTISSTLAGAGTSLTKTGAGILTLSGNNSYAGETIISAGTLKLGNIAALGAGTGAADGTTISAGATLDLGGILIPTANADAERITVSGSGVGGNGAIISSTAIATPFNGVRFLTLAGDTTLGFSNRWDVGHNTGTGPSSLAGAGFTLNFLGTAAAAQASLNNLGATDLGDIHVDLGSVAATNILYIQGTTDLGRPENTMTITGGSTVDLFTNQTNTSFDKKFALNNGILRVSKTGAISLPGTISLTTATNTIHANGGTVAITAGNILSGAGSLTKDGAGSLTLSNANTYTGTTSINAGTLSINSILNVNGGASSVGAPTTIPDGTISMGNAGATGTLLHTGTGDATTDRVINLSGTTGGATLNQSGSGALKFTSDFTATGIGGKTLTLTGSTAGTGEIAGAIINNGTVSTPTLAAAYASGVNTITLSDVTGFTIGSRITGTGITPATVINAINTTTKVVTLSINTNGAGTVGQTLTITASTAVAKTGTGTWTLSGTNTHTGTTSINGAGVLRIDNPASIPGGIGATGGTSYLLFNNNAILGLGGTGTQPNFNRPHGVNRVDGFYFQSNGGFAAFDQDRVVNVGGSNGTSTWLNGKTIILGHSTATHKVTISNPFNITTVTRPLQVDDGSGAVDGELSGAISHNAGAFAGVDKTGNGAVAFTGNSTFFGSLVVRAGTVIVNKVTNSGTASPIGQGTSGFTLAGGTFQYAPVDGVGGEAATVNRTFGIAASSSLDASGTGALVLDNTAAISPDVTGQTGSWAASGSANITGLTSTVNLAIGMRVTSSTPGIPANATITQILSSTSVSLNANTTAAATGAPVTFGYPSARTLTLTGTNTDANTIAGILQDSSSISAGVLSITKTGAGTWVLSGPNTYTGPTAINGGTLFITGANQGTSAITFGGGNLGLDIAAPVNAAGATVDFTGQTVLVTGTPTLASYTLLTASSITGTPALAAPAPSGYALQVFNDNELRLVQTGNTFASWIAGFPGVGAFTGVGDDADGDGIDNGVENFFGTNPSAFSSSLVAGTVSGGIFTFTHPQNTTPASDLTAAYQWSKDLATFHASAASDGDTTVTFTTQADTPSPGITTVTATVTGTATSKLFVSVKVTQN